MVMLSGLGVMEQRSVAVTALDGCGETPDFILIVILSTPFFSRQDLWTTELKRYELYRSAIWQSDRNQDQWYSERVLARKHAK